jgi:uncharacterized iron-regulated protein
MEAARYQPDRVALLDLREGPSLDDLAPLLKDQRVVFVGETHTRYDHHLNQLQVIRQMHAQDPRLAIGLEFFQQPFQQVLDDYIAGRIDEARMLRDSEYFQRWRFDYRLYRPILRYAREQGIPLVALNVPSELVRQVSTGGYQSVELADWRWLPPADAERDEGPGYRERLRQVFHMHPNADSRKFEYFVQAQRTWDEAMAARAADYLRQHPQTRMVILAGRGHVDYGDGIPKRLQRRMDVPMLRLVNGQLAELDRGLGDYLLAGPEVSLPPQGKFGLMLEDDVDGLRVTGFGDSSPAAEAGVERDDRLLAIDGVAIRDYADLRIRMLDHSPGDRVRLAVERQNLILGADRKEFEVTLR